MFLEHALDHHLNQPPAFNGFTNRTTETRNCWQVRKSPRIFFIFHIPFGKLRYKCEGCDQETVLYMTQNPELTTLDKNPQLCAFRQLAPPSSKQDMGTVPLDWRGENISQIVSHGKMQSVC